MLERRNRLLIGATCATILLATGCRHLTGGGGAQRDGATGGAVQLVGIGYQCWFRPLEWDKRWDEPELGLYDSSDPDVIRQHAEWLEDAGVDFVWIDWSNNIMAGPERPGLLRIEDATRALFDVYAELEHKPKISIFLGIDGNPEHVANGNLARKADQVYDTYVADPKYRPLLLEYLGKPLLVIYVWCPPPPAYLSGPPDWDDPRFTVRWMTGFMDDQPYLVAGDGRSKFGYWSWWDRSPQTYSVFDGKPEAMVVSAAFPGPRGWGTEGTMGRRDGDTFREQWARVRAVGPKIVLINSWNEWVPNEEIDPEFSNDVEPSKV
ncbi:MAG TPA: hypothetical protein HPP77_07540, partial [Candidatus Hydrogenedentes bacterium]|nr:hypothetical protein [Candidatus Hydrogenedentota bacterium]